MRLQTERDWLQVLFLVDPVHLFMRSVLVRLIWGSELDANPSLTHQALNRVKSNAPEAPKPPTIIRAHDLGNPALATFAAAGLEQLRFKNVGESWMIIAGIVATVVVCVVLGILANRALRELTAARS